MKTALYDTRHVIKLNPYHGLDEGGQLFSSGGEIDSRTVAAWPLRYSVAPLASVLEFAVRNLGEADTEEGREKALDTIFGRIVNVDLAVDSNYDGEIDDDDEPLEMDPGGLVCFCANKLTRIELKLEPAGLPGKVTLSVEKGGGLIRVWANTNRTEQITLPKTWNAGALPGTLWVEGVTNSVTARDVELRLEYDKNPSGQDNPLLQCADAVRLTVIGAEFIDDIPDYSLDTNTDSDNYFLRQHSQTTGHSDYMNLDIFYRIIPAGIDVSDVKINVYEENTGTKVTFGSENYIIGDTDASGDFKTGDNLKVKWKDVRDASGNFRDVGFYRLELEVYVNGSTTPICKTPIDDADASMPGWQCPQKGLGIHDLAYKHRPLVYVGGNETVAENGPVYPFSAAIKDNLRLLEDIFPFDGPAWSEPPEDYATFGEFDTPAASFKEFTYRYPVLNASRVNDAAHSHNHYIDVDDANRGCSLGAPTLFHRGHPSPSGAANFVFVQYWMYESASHSPYHLTLPFFNNTFTHEADWEMIQTCLRLTDASDPSNKAKWFVPHAATASQHYYGQTLAWRFDHNGPAIINQRYALTVEDGARIVVYIAENAHASYFRSGTFEVTVTDGCGTQVQYSPTYSLYYDDISAPLNSVDCDLIPLNYKEDGTVDLKGIGDWNGRWGEPAPTGIIRGPFYRAANIQGGGNFILHHNPVQFHNRCRKQIGGADDPETSL